MPFLLEHEQDEQLIHRFCGLKGGDENPLHLLSVKFHQNKNQMSDKCCGRSRILTCEF